MAIYFPFGLSTYFLSILSEPISIMVRRQVAHAIAVNKTETGIQSL